MTFREINSLLQECIDKGHKPYAIVMTEKGLDELRELIVEAHYKVMQSGPDIPEYIIKQIARWASPHGVVNLFVNPTLKEREVIVVSAVCSQTREK